MKRGHETRGMAGAGLLAGLPDTGSQAIALSILAAIIKPRLAFSLAVRF